MGCFELELGPAGSSNIGRVRHRFGCQEGSRWGGDQYGRRCRWDEDHLERRCHEGSGKPRTGDFRGYVKLLRSVEDCLANDWTALAGLLALDGSITLAATPLDSRTS